MTNRMRAGIVLLVIAPLANGACGDNDYVPPTAPGQGTNAPGQPLPPDNRTTINCYVADTAFRPLAGAHVEVVDGPQAGLSTLTGAEGSFRLIGQLDANTQFRASKADHIAATTTPGAACPSCNPQRYVSFSLESVVPPVNIAGSYTVTFTADAACTALPSEVRTRTYAAIVTPSAYRPNTTFDVTFPDAPLLDDFKLVWIGVAGNFVAFWLGDAHGQPGLVERVSPNTYLALEGSATGSAEMNSTSISMTLAGSFEYCEQATEMGRIYECRAGPGLSVPRCSSNNHGVLLTRR